MKRLTKIHNFDYYSIMFFLLALIGWLWEVILYFVTEHTFINRGVYKGPYLPIYGAGGVLLYLLLHRLKKKPVLVFSASMVLCSVLEYFTSWFLEFRWDIRWWDYSSHFMNLNGRICLLGAVVFGIGGTGFICLLLPAYEKLYQKMPEKLRTLLMVAFILIFVIDAAYGAMKPNMGYGISDIV